MDSNFSVSSELRSVTISCKAPKAETVFVAGTFNEWSPDRTPLKKDPKGVWTTTLELSPGHYEFKYLIDGLWCCEPSCPDGLHMDCKQCVPNAFGTMNRKLNVT